MIKIEVKNILLVTHHKEYGKRDFPGVMPGEMVGLIGERLQEIHGCALQPEPTC